MTDERREAYCVDSGEPIWPGVRDNCSFHQNRDVPCFPGYRAARDLPSSKPRPDELVVVPLSSLPVKVCTCDECESDDPPWPDPPHPGTPFVAYQKLSDVLANAHHSAWEAGAQAQAWAMQHNQQDPPNPYPKLKTDD